LPYKWGAKMPKCEICNKKVTVVYKCNECGSNFCEKCGKKEKLSCNDCVEYEEQSQGSYKLEQEIEMSSEDAGE
jgi:predicted nucleic acid binding AN1-type Zn finger protein